MAEDQKEVIVAVTPGQEVQLWADSGGYILSNGEYIRWGRENRYASHDEQHIRLTIKRRGAS